MIFKSRYEPMVAQLDSNHVSFLKSICSGDIPDQSTIEKVKFSQEASDNSHTLSLIPSQIWSDISATAGYCFCRCIIKIAGIHSIPLDNNIIDKLITLDPSLRNVIQQNAVEEVAEKLRESASKLYHLQLLQYRRAGCAVSISTPIFSEEELARTTELGITELAQNVVPQSVVSEEAIKLAKRRFTESSL